MRLALSGLLGALLLGALFSPAVGLDWGGIAPGVSTQATVRERYGSPSKETRETQEGYDTARWVYEGARAPAGIRRMVVDFGLLTPQGFRADVVRSFSLEPKPRIFPMQTVLDGWGPPDRAGVQDKQDVLFYKGGLLVFFPEGGTDATLLLFTIPQPGPPGAPPQ